MNAQIVKGHFAGIPHGKSVVNIDSADVALLLSAATGLVQVIAGVALAGAGAVLGVKLIGEIISGMLQAFNAPLAKPLGPDPKLPMGSAPCWIDVSGGHFWGIVLDQDFTFSIDGGQRVIPYSMIHRLEFNVRGFFSYTD